MEEKLLTATPKVKDDIDKFLPNKKVLEKLANHFYSFSDQTRLKIISCLSLSKMCVGDISTLLKLNQTTVSHQLKILKSQNIVTAVRTGKIITYGLTNKLIDDTLLIGANFVFYFSA